jgi:hypothetical protein
VPGGTQVRNEHLKTLPPINSQTKDGCHGYEEKEEGQEGCEEEVQLIWTNVAFIWNAALPSVFAKCPKTVFRQSGWTKVRPL